MDSRRPNRFIGLPGLITAAVLIVLAILTFVFPERAMGSTSAGIKVVASIALGVWILGYLVVLHRHFKGRKARK